MSRGRSPRRSIRRRQGKTTQPSRRAARGKLSSPGLRNTKRETKIRRALEGDSLVNSKGRQDLGVTTQGAAFLGTDAEGCDQGCHSLHLPQLSYWRHQGFSGRTGTRWPGAPRVLPLSRDFLLFYLSLANHKISPLFIPPLPAETSITLNEMFNHLGLWAAISHQEQLQRSLGSAPGDWRRCFILPSAPLPGAPLCPPPLPQVATLWNKSINGAYLMHGSRRLRSGLARSQQLIAAWKQFDGEKKLTC